MRRPLLQAHRPTNGDGPPPVLLIDEVDRADDEFEAFLLEVLSDYAITVPELGTFRAEVPPVVVITSNRTRDVHDALKRRCLYHWVEHPDFDREVAIVRLRAPEVPERLARQVAAAVEGLRAEGLYKPPGRGRDDRLGRGAGHARPHRRSTRRRSPPRSARSSSTARTTSGCASKGVAAARAGGRAARHVMADARDGRRRRWPARSAASAWRPRPTPPWPTPPPSPRSGIAPALVRLLGRAGHARAPPRGRRRLRPGLRRGVRGHVGSPGDDGAGATSSESVTVLVDTDDDAGAGARRRRAVDGPDAHAALERPGGAARQGLRRAAPPPSSTRPTG